MPGLTAGTRREHPAGQTHTQAAFRGWDPVPRVSTDPVPLYLIPQALSAEIHRHGNAIAGVQVRRTRHHSYRLTIDLAGEEGTDE
jgi:hypothetical protein